MEVKTDKKILLLLIWASLGSCQTGCLNLDKCIENFLSQVPQALLSKTVINYDNEMVSKVAECIEEEIVRCNFSSIFLFGSDEIEDSCSSDSGCQEKGQEIETYSKENKYSFLHCFDEHRSELIKCVITSMMEIINYLITLSHTNNDHLAKINQLKNHTLVECVILESFQACFRIVGVKYCGKDGSSLVRREIMRENKSLIDECEELASLDAKYF